MDLFSEQQAIERKWIYLDNAATSWPKPRVVLSAMANYLNYVGANPGRSGHQLAAQAARVIYDTRETLAQFLGVPDSRHLIFTPNATHSINLALKGLLTPGAHVVTSSIEHNAVLRPLNQLVDELGIAVTRVDPSADGSIHAEDVAAALNHETQLVTLTHASNVTGVINPIAGIKQAIGDVPLLVDAAQTVGVIPIDCARDNIDLLAFTGHKGLLGPTGTGGLCITPTMAERLRPLTPGGTGSRSASEAAPTDLPDKFEGGTLNAMGIAGLGAAVLWLKKVGLEELRAHELRLTEQLVNGLLDIPGIEVHGPSDLSRRTATVSFNLSGLPASEVGLKLDREHGVLVRTGLHCAPAAHRTQGTAPEGSVRLAASPLTTEDEITRALSAIRTIAAKAPGVQA